MFILVHYQIWRELLYLQELEGYRKRLFYTMVKRYISAMVYINTKVKLR